jgi:hypothetical protein
MSQDQIPKMENRSTKLPATPPLGKCPSTPMDPHTRLVLSAVPQPQATPATGQLGGERGSALPPSLQLDPGCDPLL